MILIDFCFPKLRTPKTLSDKCLKNLDSEDTSKSNMINLPNHGWNVHHSTFIIFIEHCQVNSVGKSLCFWLAKSWDCLLTHCLLTKGILFLIETIKTYQFTCNYLRNTKCFANFLLHFLNLGEISNILTEKMMLIDFVLLELRTPKTWSYKSLKCLVCEDPSTSNMVNVPNHCSNLSGSSFIISIDHC